MEAVIEKECSALGGLFQTIISDMKVGRRGRGCFDLAAGLPLTAAGLALACAVLLATCGSSGDRGVTCSPAALLRLCWVTGQATSRGIVGRV